MQLKSKRSNKLKNPFLETKNMVLSINIYFFKTLKKRKNYYIPHNSIKNLKKNYGILKRIVNNKSI
ncbi:hypothetical protein Hac_1385 [Helicobacter acinonychis str. Sheeba]|uniref:Uncharacterized protein n=1 Tax=Helicobacter acinonychis (strain Sheeba) TaxID=382638 RepID=Q17W58_HELAH|nr:hypothetical protein Hac_1385 [Helicobacter acinonychis str. Sheeba]